MLFGNNYVEHLLKLHFVFSVVIILKRELHISLIIQSVSLRNWGGGVCVKNSGDVESPL